MPACGKWKRSFAVWFLVALFVGGSPIFGEIVTYSVKKGDTLWQIAQKHSTAVCFIKRLNDLKDDALHVGQELRICRGPVRIVVGKSDCMLRIYTGSDLLAEFRVAVGKEGKTPTGLFRVKNKLTNPDWTHPETKELIKFGDPRHEIGTRWLGLGEGIGIHGTSEPDSIGKPVSRGCVRMRNEELESIFWAIPRGTVVEIGE